MTDWINGCDISHFQTRPDFDKLVADGNRFVIIKATQNLAVDPDFEWNRDQAVAHNMPWFAYPWITPTDTDATIQNFISVVGSGAIAALDWEQTGVPSSTVERWMDLIEAGLGRAGLCYRGKYPPAPVTQRITQWPWWYAEYPGNPTAAPRVPIWDGTGTPDWSSQAAIWQWSGAGREPGIATAIDLDRIAMPWAVFENWYKTRTWAGIDKPPVTPPAPTQLSASPDPITRTLMVGCSGRDVTKLQARLATLGFSVQLDGMYGPQTQGAVLQFQRTHGLAVDGVAGAATVAALGLR
jgi:GH25 family lysozyme M1 (1,4-beta-N-acetylmuramidase)